MDLPFDEVAVQVTSGYNLLSAEEFLSGADVIHVTTLVHEERVMFLREGVPIETGIAVETLKIVWKSDA